MDDGTDPSSAFLDALRTRAMDDLHEAALEYGIVLKDLAVIDRQFKGESYALLHHKRSCADGHGTSNTGDIAATMDKLTTRALQAQVEAAVRFLFTTSLRLEDSEELYLDFLECRQREQQQG